MASVKETHEFISQKNISQSTTGEVHYSKSESKLRVNEDSSVEMR